MTIEMPEVVDALSAIRSELGMVLLLLRQQSTGITKEWYTLKEAAELKGVSYEWLRHEPPRYWPNFGQPTGMAHNGRYSKMYHRTEVAKWLPMTHEQIDRAFTAHVGRAS